MSSRLIGVLLCITVCAGVAPGQNQIPNWEFDQPGDPTAGTVPFAERWYLWQGENFDSVTIVEGAGLSGPYAMKIDIGTGSVDPLQVFQSNNVLRQGATYTISFMAKADAPRTISVGLQTRTNSAQQWHVYWQQTNIQLTTEPQTFTFEYEHTDADDGGTAAFDDGVDFHFWLAGDGTDLYVDRIWVGEGSPPPTSPEDLARPYDPIPDDGATDVPRDTSLAWSAGLIGGTHDVYFGETFDDVNQASRANPGDALLSLGQTATEYMLDEPLDFDTQYYWRIDAVNAPPDSTVFRGHVWSFTTELYASPILNVTATASSSSPNWGPDNVVNGSGLNAADEHSTNPDDMWLSAFGQPLPAWIQFEFDQAYIVDSVRVWNSNQRAEEFMGFGAQDVTVEYSLDGANWSTLGDVVFVKAPGTDTYTGDVVDLENIEARYVRFVINSGWAPGGASPVGLSEVRFFQVPVAARLPEPADGAGDVDPVDATLLWREGRLASSHEVFFSTDPDAVDGGTAPSVIVSERRYSPDPLEYGQVYHWRVDEVNDADGARWAGPTWYFSTAEFFVVDDFESYTNDSPDRVFQTWIDGLGFSADEFFPQGHPGNATGGIVGYDPTLGDIMEKSIVHSGNQSMPLYYDNTASPFRSEAQRTWPLPQDWTAHGADTLTLFFHGDMTNDLNPLYLVIEDNAGGSAVVEHPDPNAVRATQWTEWTVSWDDLAGVNMAAVTTMAIGVGSRTSNQYRGAGTIYVDDVLVGSPRAAIGLVAHYELENNLNDSSGNGHDGTLAGNPSLPAAYVDGPAGLGMAMLFDGTSGHEYVDIGTFNPSIMSGRLSVALWAKWDGLSAAWQGLIGKRIGPWDRNQMMWQIEADLNTGYLKFQREGNDITSDRVLPEGEWAHVAAAFDGTTAKLYLNGEMIQEGNFSFGTDTHAPLQFGSSTSGGGNAFNGALDEIRIYDVALSQDEINALAGL